MNPYSISSLCKFLDEIGAAPRKSLSQNFLVDQNVVQKILALAKVCPGDQILEIGPGPGALTFALLKAGAKILAVEKDRLFAANLPQEEHLKVIESDILKVNLPNVTDWKVVANLPYHITAPILEKILNLPFKSITIMIQSEVADRITAKAKTADYGSLSLFVAYHANIIGKFKVAHSSFYPQPKVESTVIRLDPKPAIFPNPIPYIRKAFQQRRKQLASSLKKYTPSISKALENAKLPPFARPEELGLDEWVLLVREIEKFGEFILDSK